ncbi:GntR family transcriptional regulator [Bradyrhizobium sp. Arg237L]|uniref:GntR family transcriptional regulator n=1 Tax=Bradyrhizobium sp. Arg237L TaxID=3003352 RepID=UPI00249E328B|nr:GntR family transcriptional regulator [Bradyrhizobium sp. Arg237L]MDI4231823.1 GntR family transcriptional regulator [Bradyrhizobium sp. Arg237L]
MSKNKASRSNVKALKGASSEHAYRALMQEIVSFTLVPGEDLDEATLVARFGVSRTPVREALVRLAAEGLVQLVPNRGARVAPMGWNDIREHLEAFDVSQRLVTRWAAIRRTDEQVAKMDIERKAFETAFRQDDSVAMLDANFRFHAVIGAACRNSLLQRFYIQQLTADLRIARLAMTSECFPTERSYRSHVGQIVREHRELVEAIRERDGDRAEELARSHADLARKRVSESLTQTMTPAMEIRLGDQAADV